MSASEKLLPKKHNESPKLQKKQNASSKIQKHLNASSRLVWAKKPNPPDLTSLQLGKVELTKGLTSHDHMQPP